MQIRPTQTKLFLFASLLFYILILFWNGPLPSGLLHFSSIVLCVVYVWAKKPVTIVDWVFRIAFLFTVFADYFLTLRQSHQLLGTILFVGAQVMYAILLMTSDTNNKIGWIVFRLVLISGLMLIAHFIIQGPFDVLLFTALLYYGLLLSNALIAATRFRQFPFFSIGLLLYIGCDTLVGLSQSAAYITLEEGSIWRFLLEFPINLIWFFYLPSQVYIALSSRHFPIKKG